MPAGEKPKRPVLVDYALNLQASRSPSNLVLAAFGGGAKVVIESARAISKRGSDASGATPGN